MLLGVREQRAGRRVAGREGALRGGEIGWPARRGRSQPARALGQRVGRQHEGGDRERDDGAHAGLPDALDRVVVGVPGHDHDEQRRDRDLRVELRAGAQEQPDREPDDEQQDDRARSRRRRPRRRRCRARRPRSRRACARARATARRACRRGSRPSGRSPRTPADRLRGAARPTTRALQRSRCARHAGALCGRPRDGRASREAYPAATARLPVRLIVSPAPKGFSKAHTPI